jgi:mono/diheme cytochrome c family protein
VSTRLYLIGALWLAAAAVSPAAPKIDFDREIRPLFSDKCFACHGPDEKQRQAGLRFDIKEGVSRVITPGDSGHSRLFQRIGAANKANRMPPTASGLTLTDQQVDLIRR